jgi:YHS domain-containing protein
MKHVKPGWNLWRMAVGASVFLGIVALATAGPAENKAAKPKPYPLKTCIVTGEKLGEMGSPHVFTYQGREIKLCCKGCLKDFNKEPAKFAKKLDAAEKAAKEGKKAGGTPPPQPGHEAHGGHQH